MANLLQKLAAAAVRNRATATLRQHCPEELRAPLEELLADAAAMQALEAWVMAALKDRSSATLDSLLAAGLPEGARRLFSAHPSLPDYLLQQLQVLLPSS